MRGKYCYCTDCFYFKENQLQLEENKENSVKFGFDYVVYADHTTLSISLHIFF